MTCIPNEVNSLHEIKSLKYRNSSFFFQFYILLWSLKYGIRTFSSNFQVYCRALLLQCKITPNEVNSLHEIRSLKYNMATIFLNFTFLLWSLKYRIAVFQKILHFYYEAHLKLCKIT